jgi:hypothetical protein
VTGTDDFLNLTALRKAYINILATFLNSELDSVLTNQGF